MTYNFKAQVSEDVRNEVKELMDKRGFEENSELFLWLLEGKKGGCKKLEGYRERLDNLMKRLEEVCNDLEEISYYLGNLRSKQEEINEKLNHILYE